MTEKTPASEPGHDRSAYGAADRMEDRLTGYMFGMLDDPGPLPVLTADRLERSFGSSDALSAIDDLKNVIVLFSQREQYDIAMYFSGYPESALRKIATDRLDESLGRMRSVLIELEYMPLEVPEHASLDQLFADEPNLKARDTKLGGTALRTMLAGLPTYNSESNWQSRAECATEDPALFESEEEALVAQAKEICAGCPVANDCLLSALEGDSYGTMGGLSDEERRSLPLERKNRMVALLSGKPNVTRRTHG